MKRYFTVVGSGGFPFDMLARCECWPASSIEATKITLACPTQAPEQKIVLATQKETSGHDAGLWQAAKWPIVRGSST